MNIYGNPKNSAENVYYDNDSSGLNAENVQEAVDLVNGSITDNTNLNTKTQNIALTTVAGTTEMVGDLSFDTNTGIRIYNSGSMELDSQGDELICTGTEIVMNSTLLQPFADNTTDIGTGTKQFKDFYVSGDIKMGSTTGGFTPPVLTTIQRNAITTPVTGDIIYNSDTNKQETYNGTQWGYSYQVAVNIVTPTLTTSNTNNADFLIVTTSASSASSAGWKAFDGDGSTNWTSASVYSGGLPTSADSFDGVNGSALTATFLTPRTISNIQLETFAGSSTNIVDYRLLYSVDGTTNWTEFYSKTNYPGGDSGVVSVPPVVCKAITFQCTKNANAGTIIVKKLIYGGPDVDVFRPTTIDSDARDALVPSAGMVIYNTDHELINYRNGDHWHDMSGTSFEYHHGSSVTQADPQIFAAAAVAVLINDSLGIDTVTSQGPISGAHFYNSENNTSQGKITPENEGDSYVIGVRLIAKSSTATGAFSLRLKITDDNGDDTIIKIGSSLFPLGSGVLHTLDFTVNVYVGALFLKYGASIELTSDVAQTTVEDVSYLINRVHKGRGKTPSTILKTPGLPYLTSNTSNTNFTVTTSPDSLSPGWRAFDGTSTTYITSGTAFSGSSPDLGVYLGDILCEWVKVEFPSRKHIINYKVEFPASTAKGVDWTIQISQDDVHWTPIQSYVGNTAAAPDIVSLNCKCKYIALCITKNGSNGNAQVTELTFNVPVTVVVPVITSNLGNPSYLVSSSSVYTNNTTYDSWKAFNGVTGGSSRWLGANAVYNTGSGAYEGSNSLDSFNGEWLKLSFDYPKIVTSYRMYSTGTSGSNPFKYQILVSDDDVNWTSVDSETTYTGGNTGVITLGSGPYSCLHIAMIIEGLNTSGNSGYCEVYEITYA
jgi:hypothetical protein